MSKPSLKKHLLTGLMSLSFFSLSACSQHQTVSFSVIKESNQCQLAQEGITKISDKQSQEEFIKLFNRFSDDKETYKKLQELVESHLNTEDLYLISQGQKPSAGYGFNISGNVGAISNNTLTLPIKFTAPKSGSLSAQMITNPCLAIGVNSEVDYQEIVIDDLKLNISK